MAGVAGVVGGLYDSLQVNGHTNQLQTNTLERGGQPTAGDAAISPGPGPAYKLELSQNDWQDANVRQMKRTGSIECQTCKERKYQDGSNDPGVSFKAPGHIAPENSASAVMAHEQEHVANEQANARETGRKVISQSVKIFTSVCPECGKSYVAGGETRTTTAADSSQQQEKQLGGHVNLLA